MPINPITGEIMPTNGHDNVLIYRLDREERSKVERLVSRHYNVIDCSSDFTDLLALPAAALIVNPLLMNNDDLYVFNEWLSDNIDGSMVILTRPFPIEANFTHIQMNDKLNSKFTRKKWYHF